MANLDNKKGGKPFNVFSCLGFLIGSAALISWVLTGFGLFALAIMEKNLGDVILVAFIWGIGIYIVILGSHDQHAWRQGILLVLTSSLEQLAMLLVLSYFIGQQNIPMLAKFAISAFFAGGFVIMQTVKNIFVKSFARQP